MSVTLSPIAPRYAVSDADDPFKKYWWAILMGIVFTALWLLTPMLGEKSVGSTAIDTSKPKVDENVEQSLSADAGDGTYLSMEGSGKKRKADSLFGSSLYEAPPEVPAPAATAGSAALGSASGSTLADALKKVGESSGGWGEKAQKGFNIPKLAGGSLSGMGAAAGGKAGGSSAFGSSNAKIGFAGTKGLSGGGGGGDGDSDPAAPASKGLDALKAASAQSLLAAGSKSNDDSRSKMGMAFDGAKGGSKIGGGAAALGGGYAALDAAPANLKLDDPKLNEKKLTPPPGVDAGASDMKDSDMAKQIALQLVAGAIGGAIGGPMGGVITSAIMKAIEQQEAQARKVRELEDKKNLERAGRGGK